MTDECPVILFYKYVPIVDPSALCTAQKQLCSSLGLRGRVLIAEEGINGTLAGPVDATNRYMEALHADPRFSDLEFKVTPGHPGAFPRLMVKVRPEIVALKSQLDLKPDRDNHLSPAEWKQTIEQDPEAVLVDVRNRYESAAGKFANAIECEIENFRELPEYLTKLESLKEKKILMYCTGGIRCEKASALFRSQGFKNVFQLRGGIITYQKEFGNAHWHGECFVFDQRMTVSVEENLVQIGRCAHTNRPSARFVNCRNDNCHTLFILSEEAEQENLDFRFCPKCFAKTAQ